MCWVFNEYNWNLQIMIVSLLYRNSILRQSPRRASFSRRWRPRRCSFRASAKRGLPPPPSPSYLCHAFCPLNSLLHSRLPPYLPLHPSPFSTRSTHALSPLALPMTVNWGWTRSVPTRRLTPSFWKRLPIPVATIKTTPFSPFASWFRCSTRSTSFLDFRGKLLGLVSLVANALLLHLFICSVLDSEPNVGVNPVVEFQVVNYIFFYSCSQNCYSFSSGFNTSQAENDWRVFS